MLKRMIGAAIGAKLAKNSPAVGGATGAALGAAVPFVLSRVSLPAMIALGVGGYVAKRYFDKQEPGRSRSSAKTTPGQTTTPFEVSPVPPTPVQPGT